MQKKYKIRLASLTLSIFFGLTTFIYLPNTVQAAMTCSQSNFTTYFAGSNQSTHTINLPASVPAGALIVAGIANRTDLTTTISSVSDNLNGTTGWTAGSSQTASWFYYKTNSNSGSGTITVNFSAPINTHIISGWCSDTSGILGFDAVVINTISASTAINSSLVSTNSEGGTVGFFAGNNNVTLTANGANETSVSNPSSSQRTHMFFEPYSSAGSYGFQATASGNTTGPFHVIAFRNDGGFSPSPTPIPPLPSPVPTPTPPPPTPTPTPAPTPSPVPYGVANYPLQITQPQASLTTRSRYYKAYPGIEYRVPVGVFGGLYPFTYSLATAPLGMSINSSGIITWPSPTESGSPHNVTVRVTDAAGSVQTRSWTITVTTQGFLFIDANNGTHAQGFGCTSNCGTGTLTNPFRSMIDVYQGTTEPAWRNSNFVNHFIYWRGGTYGLEGFFENMEIPQQAQFEYRANIKPHVWMAYPGESVTIDQNLLPGTIGAAIDFRDGDSTDVFIQGIRFIDGVNHSIRLRGHQRIVFFENSFSNVGPMQNGHNSSFIMFTGSGVQGTDMYNFVKDNLFENGNSLNGGSYIKTYSLGYSVFEGNTFRTPSGPEMEGLAIKANDRHIDVRSNTFDGDFTSGAISGNWADGSHYEIRHNNIKNANISTVTGNNLANGAITINYHGTTYGPVYIHRNTFEGVVMVRRADTGEGPFYIYNNVIVDNNSGTPTDSHLTLFPSSGDVPNPSVVILGSGSSANLVGFPSSNIVDSNGNLTSTYASYLGTHGYQLGAGSPTPTPTPPPPSPTPTPPPPTPTPTPVVGDINLDHIVNSLDWSLMNSSWFGTNASADLNRDGSVNSLDFALLSSNWLRTW